MKDHDPYEIYSAHGFYGQGIILSTSVFKFRYLDIFKENKYEVYL